MAGGSSTVVRDERRGPPLGAVARLNRRDRLPGTDDATFPFWSPDSHSVGFFAELKLKRVDIYGGAPQNTCVARRPPAAAPGTRMASSCLRRPPQPVRCSACRPREATLRR